VSGQPVSAAVRLEYAHGEQRLHAAAGAIASLARLRGAEFRLPVERVRELKVWAHRVTPEGSSEGLAGVVEVECGGVTRQFPLGPLLLPVAGESCRVWITLAAQERAAWTNRRTPATSIVAGDPEHPFDELAKPVAVCLLDRHAGNKRDRKGGER
jgi:hypothetical protein